MEIGLYQTKKGKTGGKIIGKSKVIDQFELNRNELHLHQDKHALVPEDKKIIDNYKSLHVYVLSDVEPIPPMECRSTQGVVTWFEI